VHFRVHECTVTYRCVCLLTRLMCMGTGSGKTFTMMGTNGSRDHEGLYVQASRDIFANIGRPEYAHLIVVVSFFEIYGGKLFDLLNGRQKLVAREDGQQKCQVGVPMT
jgi:kinesin family protein 2/24